jgi:hypothetical protein
MKRTVVLSFPFKTSLTVSVNFIGAPVKPGCSPHWRTWNSRDILAPLLVRLSLRLVF